MIILSIINETQIFDFFLDKANERALFKEHLRKHKQLIEIDEDMEEDQVQVDADIKPKDVPDEDMPSWACESDNRMQENSGLKPGSDPSCNGLEVDAMSCGSDEDEVGSKPTSNATTTKPIAGRKRRIIAKLKVSVFMWW